MMINLTTIFILICVVIPATYFLFYMNREMSNDDDVMLRIAMFLVSLGIFIMMIGWCWAITC
jgi:cytochrome bd-type quinol oxidase subunit 1